MRRRAGCSRSERPMRPGRRRLAAALGSRRSDPRAMKHQMTAIIGREGDGYVALCPELDIASQGDTVELAHDNLRAALELFFEVAPPEEVQRRLNNVVKE